MATALDSDDRQEEPNWRRRVGLAVAFVLGLVVTYILIYHWAVTTIAGVEDRSIIKSAQIVVEAVTTAGFGGDTDLWREHTELAFFVMVMNLTGVLLVFLAIPLFGVPLLRNALDPPAPRSSTLEGHVIICGYSAMDDVLKSELDEAGVPYLFVESDPEMVHALNENDMDAIHGNAERVDTLINANVKDALALVADVDDETNPTVILSAARVNPDLQIVSVARTHHVVPYHEFAGADDVVVSKESLGESLARRSMKTVSERFQEALGQQVEIEFDEYLVEEGSEMIGKTIEEIDIFGGDVTVIGGWFGARFLISPPPKTVIRENTILLITGKQERLQEPNIRKLPSHVGHPSRVIVCGNGDVGGATARILAEGGIDVCLVDLDPGESVDIEGDITQPGTLERAGIKEARSLVLAVDDDATAIYATLLVKHHAPGVEIITRANDPENVWKLYNAGADFVLSLPDVTGEVLAATLLDEVTILTPTDDFDFIRTKAPAFAGQRLDEANIRDETGSTVVAVERDGHILTEFGADFVFERDDELIAAGTPASLSKLESLTH